MAVFDLGATALIERSKEAAIHAMMLDPLTAAVLSPAEINHPRRLRTGRHHGRQY